MGDPLDKATAQPPATLGEGCLSRYDLEQLNAEAGTDFPGAAELWQTLHPENPGVDVPGVDTSGVDTPDAGTPGEGDE